MNNSNNENNQNNISTNNLFQLNNNDNKRNIEEEIIIIDDIDIKDDEKYLDNDQNQQPKMTLDEMIKKILGNQSEEKEIVDNTSNNQNIQLNENNITNEELFLSDELLSKIQPNLPVYPENITEEKINNNNLITNNQFELPETEKDLFFSIDSTPNNVSNFSYENEDTIPSSIEEEEPDIINENYEVPIIESIKNETIEKRKPNIPVNENKKNKNEKKMFNKTFLIILMILIFIAVCILTIKTFYFGKKVDNYEEFFTVIEEKSDDEVKISENKNVSEDNLKKAAAEELISCIDSSVDMKNLPTEINSIITQINNYYNQSNNHFAFVYKDLFTGFTVTYNIEQSIFAASSIKAPTDIYIWEMASQGKVNLDEMLTYTSSYYNTGSGVLKNNAFNTQYSVRKLLEYSTVTSDNAAHNMLMDKYGRENMLKFWQEKGTKTIFTEYTNWGPTSGHDAMIYMEELYNFYISNDEYGNAIMTNFINSYPKFLKGKNNYKVASKSGWSGSSLHEMAIIFADNPYIVIALSNLGDTGYYTSYFDTANDLAYKLHTEYWKYKINKCNEIKQY